MLNISNLACNKGDFGLNIDKLDIKKRGLILVQGNSNEGKSTFLKCLAGIHDYDGQIKFKNINLSSFNFKQRAKIIGYMPQNILVSDRQEQNVSDFLIMGRLPYTNFLNHYTDKDWGIVYNVASVFHLTRSFDKQVSSLNEDEIRRILLARIFIQAPEVVLLDEPTLGLTEEHRIQFFNFIDDYIKIYRGKMIIISSRDPLFLSKGNTCNLIVKDGTIIKQDCCDTEQVL